MDTTDLTPEQAADAVFDYLEKEGFLVRSGDTPSLSAARARSAAGDLAAALARIEAGLGAAVDVLRDFRAGAVARRGQGRRAGAGDGGGPRGGRACSRGSLPARRRGLALRGERGRPGPAGRAGASGSWTPSTAPRSSWRASRSGACPSASSRTAARWPAASPTPRPARYFLGAVGPRRHLQRPARRASASRRDDRGRGGAGQPQRGRAAATGTATAARLRGAADGLRRLQDGAGGGRVWPTRRGRSRPSTSGTWRRASPWCWPRAAACRRSTARRSLQPAAPLAERARRLAAGARGRPRA